jgi:hypothetical protein
MKKNSRESGFGIVGALLVLVIVVLVSLLWWQIWHNKTVSHKSSSVNNGTPSAQYTGSSTLTGVVTEGPTAPVCTAGQSCSDIVADHTIVVLDSSGKIIATTKTNSSGSYSVKLSPGQYTLKLTPYIGISDRSYQVMVSTGPTQFNIEADTGIR